MCGRFTLRQADGLADRFQLDLVLDAPAPRYNVAPTQAVPIVVQRDDGRQLTEARWGLIPSWAKDPSIGNRLINARAETLAERPSFRSALRARRCLIPADGFYEWAVAAREATGESRRGRASKQPYFIHRRDDALFAFAGLYEVWRDPAGQSITSCTIVTTTPNALMQPLHDRMPAILLPEHEADWLAPDAVEAGLWPALLQPYPDEMLEARPVSPLVNSPAHEGPEVLG